MPICTCEACTRERGEDFVPYECAECGEQHRYASEADNCCDERYYCPDCGGDYEYESDALECCATDEYPSDYPPLQPLDNPYPVTVAELPNRPARRCSIEQEITAGAWRAARLMSEIGLAGTEGVCGYQDDCRPGSAIVKEDGSLPEDGAEVVYSRFRLDSIADSANLSAGLARMRELKEQGLVSSGRSAGTHIHIAARAESGETYQPQHMASLHEVFCHLEDTLYALAACGWDEHRLDEYGDGYCKVLPKIKDSTPAKVLTEMRADRYFGLNFQRLIEAVSRCQCGGCYVGDWESCDCGTMDKATVEWRLFNSSTRPDTIHAWLLVAHAVTAYAARHTLGTLEPTPIRSGDPESRWAQLEWMLENCPFADNEREVVRKAARRSPGFGEHGDTY